MSAAPETAVYAPNPFVRIDASGTVTVISKHLEAGEGNSTGLATLLAEELGAAMAQVRVEAAPADERIYNNLFFGPMQGTGGSTAIANSYPQYREAGAQARAGLAAAAAGKWGVPIGEITVQSGLVSHGSSGRQASFGELAGLAATQATGQVGRLKDPAEFSLIGRYDTRLDVVPKVNGAAEYAMDVRLPGMLTAVVARPSRFGGTVKSFDAAKAKAVAGVTDVVAIPQGVAVVAENTWAAIRGRAALTIDWDESAAETRGSEDLLTAYRALLDTPGRPFRNEGDVAAALAGADTVVEAVYEFPFLAHAPLEPLNCVARLGKDDCEIWAGSQIQTWDQANAAAAAGLDVRSVRINTLYAGGSFGRRANPPSDYISEAVHVAKAIGGRAPVHLVWTREDDIRGGRYRPLYLHGLRGGLDATGKAVAWRQRIVGQSLQANTPFQGALVVDGIDLTSVEGVRDISYGVPNLACELHTTTVGVPVLWWRSVGHTHTAFAVESFMDELAAAAGLDPLELRTSLLAGDPRKLTVLNLAAGKAGWGSPLPAGRGRGLAVHKSFDTYVAQVAEVAVAEDGTISVERVVCAVDCGVAVNPDIVRAQMEGGITFGLSAALGEAVTLEAGRVVQSGYNDYKLLRFGRHPKIEVHIVASTEAPTGVGEPGVPPIAPAVANAVFAATGKRLRKLPFSTVPA